MAKKTFGQVAKEVPAAAGAEAPPPGKYTATVVGGFIRDTKAGDPRLVLKCAVDSGPHARKTALHGMMLRIANETSVQIFTRTVSTLGLDPDADLGDFELGDPEAPPSEEVPDPVSDHHEKIRKLLEFVLEKVKGSRAEMVVQQRDNFPPEARWLNTIKADAPPSQLSAEDSKEPGAKPKPGGAGSRPRPAAGKRPSI